MRKQAKSNKLRRGRYCVFSLTAHLVFVPKYRKKVFTAKRLKILRGYFERILNDFETTLVEFNGETDHVHLLIEYPPKHSISKIVNSLKGVSSRYLRKYHKEEVAPFLWGDAFWSPSYFVGSVGGATIEKLRQYIEEQNSPS